MRRQLAALFLLLGAGSVILGSCGKKQDADWVDIPVDATETENEIKEMERKDASVISLMGGTATLDGVDVENFDYSWHSDPAKGEEWYEGTKPQTDAAVYIAHDICYYPVLPEDGFVQEEYDGETEWVYHYTAEGLTDYIYATLPVEGETIPIEMMHTEEEAYNNQVLHIVKPGTYILQGEWHGQILVDLGDPKDTAADEKAKVKLILQDVDVTCDCAPAFLAYSAYECDNGWEEKENTCSEVDTSNAGVEVVIADGSVNSFTGTNVYRMLKAEYKKEGSTVQKKAHKLDGAFYSCVSMKIRGEEKNSGICNIISGFEGLDSELHLTIDGGNINIYAQNDGINVNEDKVSVFTMNDGVLHVFSGLGFEGDGIDSNGYIVVNGGTIAGGTPSGSDSLLDSDCGNTINGGEVITIGSQGMMHGGMMGERPEGFGGKFNGERPEDFEDGKREMRGDKPGEYALPEGEKPQGEGNPPEGLEPMPDGTEHNASGDLEPLPDPSDDRTEGENWRSIEEEDDTEEEEIPGDWKPVK